MPSRRISGRLRSISGVTSNSSSMIGAGPFSLASSRPASQPASASSLRDALGEGDRVARAVLHAQHRDRRAEPEEAHAVAALAHDLVALLLERQAVDLDDVVEHAREDLHHLAVLVPVEARMLGERVAHEARQVHRAEQAGAVGRQRLLAARVGGADVLAPPVVVHLVDAVDQHEAGLGEVVGRRHDHVPHALRRHGLVDLAEHQALVVAHVARRCAGHSRQMNLRGIAGVLAGDLFLRVTGKASFQSRSSRTAFMNSSVTSSDRLNCRRRPASRLARMNSIASGGRRRTCPSARRGGRRPTTP